MAYHYHLMMLVETAEEIAAFCEATDDAVGLLLDTGHAYAAGADYGEIMRRFGSRIVHIHLKDVRRNVLDWVRKNDVSFNSAVREGLFTVPGDGCLDFSEIANFVRDVRLSRLGGRRSRAGPCKGDSRGSMRRRRTDTFRHLMF